MNPNLDQLRARHFRLRCFKIVIYQRVNSGVADSNQMSTAPNPSGSQDDEALPRSPIRPQPPSPQQPPKPRLVPVKPGTGSLNRKHLPEAENPSDQTAEFSSREALERLRLQMAQAAEEFAAGRINRAQFYAIYGRYNEQRSIVEQLVERNPDSNAWKQVVRPGHTSFLRQHFEARTLSLALYQLNKPTPIIRYGLVHPDPKVLFPILRSLPNLIRQRGPLGPARKEVNEGRWLMLAPGKYTVTVVLFSLEPSGQQIKQMADLQQDFERANIHMFERDEFEADRLVFPQRALFEK